MLKMGSGHIDNEEIAFLNERFLSSIYQHVDATFEANSNLPPEMANMQESFIKVIGILF